MLSFFAAQRALGGSRHLRAASCKPALTACAVWPHTAHTAS
jgi:hypothetical protein